MKTNANTLLIILAIGLGLTAFGLASVYLKSIEEVHPVVVVRRDIPPRTEIRPSDLVVREVHRSAIMPNAFTSIDEVYQSGELVMSKSTIYANQQLIRDAVERKSVANSLSYLLTLYGTSQDNRAYSITTNRSSSFGGRIQPFDIVDVIAVFDARGILGESVSKRVLTNVQVLDVVGNPIDETRRDVEVVTLLLTEPRQAELLAMVDEFASSIHLALVPKTGTPSIRVTRGYTPTELMQELGLSWIPIPIVPGGGN